MGNSLKFLSLILCTVMLYLLSVTVVYPNLIGNTVSNRSDRGIGTIEDLYKLTGRNNLSTDVTEQTDQPGAKQGQTETQWFQIIGLSSILSGVTSAIVSAIFNYRLTLKQIRLNHTNTLNQIDKQITLNQNNTMTQIKANHANSLVQIKAESDNAISEMKKATLLAELKERLNLYASMIYFLRKIENNGATTTPEKDKMLSETDSLVRSKIYLLDSKIADGWLRLDGDYLNRQATGTLMEILVKEYNTEIIPIYNQTTGNSLKPI